MTMGMYRGRREEEPGKLIYRHKGVFSHIEDALKEQKKIVAQGKHAKIVTYTDGYSLYVVAPHDFWKKSFIIKRR